MTDMTDISASTVTKLLEEELDKAEPFENFHGITAENVRSFVVAPRQQLVDPDDGDRAPCKVWVAMELPGNALLSWDPFDDSWAIVETLPDASCIITVGGDSLAEVLDGM